MTDTGQSASPAPSSRIGTFQVDVIGWIPQPEVDNPLAVLPSTIKSLLPAGMADPYIGGDNFTTPAATPGGMTGPFRVKQSASFDIATWGTAPTMGANTITPGVTTSLDARRAAGGKVTFSLTATILSSSASVSYSSFGDCYEVAIAAVAQDPVPAAAAAAIISKASALPAAARLAAMATAKSLASTTTPSLGWDAMIRIQRGLSVNLIFSAGYAMYQGTDLSGTIPGVTPSLGSTSNLIHGKVSYCLWPSAVIYLTYTPAAGTGHAEPIFFSDGSGVSPPEVLKIVIPKYVQIRRVTW